VLSRVWGGLLHQLAGVEDGPQFIHGGKEGALGHEPLERVVGGVGAGDVESDVEVYRKHIACQAGVAEQDGPDGRAAVKGVWRSARACEVGTVVARPIVRAAEDGNGDVGYVGHDGL
jgi:hypothetical protein